jgi:uncharacterized glyoxalase superfamily protein PhnB
MASRRKARTGGKAPPGSARRAARKPARRKVRAVPAAYGSVTPALVLRDCLPAIAFYRQAFGARPLSRMETPDGKTLHAEIRIGDRIVMLGDEAPEQGLRSAESLGGTPATLMLYVKDCDAVFARAVAGGAKALLPPTDMFWGDRYAQVLDPFGHRWAIATRKVDLTPRQMARAADEWTARQGAQPEPGGGGPE